MRTRKPGAPVPLTKKRETVFGFGRQRTARPVLQQDVLSRSVSCVPENRVRPSRSLRRRRRFVAERFKRTRKPGALVPLTKKRETFQQISVHDGSEQRVRYGSKGAQP